MTTKKKTATDSKVMDVSKPGKTQPSTTSRPVIVTNRPMIAEDPMIAQAAAEAIEKKEKATPKEEVVATAPVLTPRREKKIMPPSETAEEAGVLNQSDELEASSTKSALVIAEEEEEPIQVKVAKKSESSAASEAVEAESVGTEKDTVEVKRAAVDVPDDPVDGGVEDEPVEEAPDEKSAAKDESEKEEVLIGVSAEKEEPTGGSTVGSSQDSANMGEFTKQSQMDQGDSDEKEETAEQKRLAEIEKTITKGTYFVPINQAGRRRERVILSILFIILLGLLLVNLLLDMGMISIPGVPHTKFFHVS